MPTTVQDCVNYINAHIYENSNKEVSATEVKTALLMMLEVITSFAPKGEYPSDAAANTADLATGDTYIIAETNEFGLPRGIQKTFFKT